MRIMRISEGQATKLPSNWSRNISTGKAETGVSVDFQEDFGDQNAVFQDRHRTCVGRAGKMGFSQRRQIADDLSMPKDGTKRARR